MIRTNLQHHNKKQSIDFFRHLLHQTNLLDRTQIDLFYRLLIEDSGTDVRQRLEQEWYSTTDFSIYDRDEYLIEAWYCWHNYSRQYTNNIVKPNTIDSRTIRDTLPEYPRIVDLGNGIGFTSAALKQIIPNATVIGTNIATSTQYRIAEHLANIYDFTMTSDLATIQQPVDLLFASEYFEHHQDPVTHLETTLEQLQPRALLLANAFTATAIGHFNTYTHNGKPTPNTKIGRIFNNTLREHNYTQTRTTLWNQRPSLWTRT